MKYRPEIDGLRALAVLPVIAFHGGATWMPGGFIGVDVFFVISGFLIAGLIAAEMQAGTFSLARFYERRVRRILPALFLVLLCCIPLAWFLMGPAQTRDFSQSLIAVPLFVSNVLFWRESGYFDGAAEEKPLLHTWSLGVEEQFYLVFPLVLLVLWRFGRRPVFYVILAAALLSLIASEIASRLSPNANFYLAPFRFWELAAGSLCALTMRRVQIKPSLWLSTLGLAMVFVSIFIFNENSRLPSLHMLFPVIGTCLILLYAVGTQIEKLLSFSPLAGIGLISYSAYLWHQPLFAFARIASPATPSAAVMFTLAAVSLILAYLSWRYVEQPFRRKTGPVLPRRMQLFVAGLLVSLGFIVIGFAGHATDGAKFRYNLTKLQNSYLETAAPSPMRGQCHAGNSKPIAPQNACEYGGADIRVAVYGDSHGVELAYALSSQLKEYGTGLKHLTHSACIRSSKPKNANFPCQIWARNALAYLKSSPDISHIVVTYRLNADLFGPHEGIYPDQPNLYTNAWRSDIMDTLKADIEALIASGKTVIFVLQSPEIPMPIEELVLKPEADKSDIRGVKTAWWDARSEYVREQLKDFSAGLIIIDPADTFCGEKFCKAGADGISYYFDDDHMSVSGAARIAEEILPYISAQ